MESDILNGAIGYLAGPIDDVDDQGITWRRDVVSKCEKIGIKFLDPTNKLSNLQKEVGEEQEKIRRFKEMKQWDELSNFMHPVARGDHRCVDLCDFIICYIDSECHMCGTYFELQSALTEKKPYFIVTKGGKEKTPSWLFGILDHNRIFDSVDAVVNHLHCLNDGTIPLDDRWVLIRKELEKL